MKDNRSLVLTIIIGLIVIAGVAAFLLFSPLKPAGPEEETEITPPKATGSINDLTDALEKEIIDEMNVVYEDDEADLIISDAEEINDFGQSADDTGL